MASVPEKQSHMSKPDASASAQGGIDVPIMQFGRDQFADSDRVAVEEPLEIRLRCPTGERNVAVTMRTPGNDQELALGFLFTEGIVSSHDDIEAVLVPGSDTEQPANVVTVVSGNPVALDKLSLDRNFYMTSSCGVCGKASLEAIRVRSSYRTDAADFSIDSATVAALPAQLLKAQEVFAGTGGIHGTALFNEGGLTGPVFEDVGRHNAVDKLIGHQLLAGMLPLSAYGLLVSGRASFELVQKACIAGCPLLAAVGAPSSLAIELAWESNMTLVGFLRDGRFNIYTGRDRILR